MRYHMLKLGGSALATMDVLEYFQNFGPSGARVGGWRDGWPKLGEWSPAQTHSDHGTMSAKMFNEAQLSHKKQVVDQIFVYHDDPHADDQEFVIFFRASSGCQHERCLDCCALMLLEFRRGLPSIALKGPVCGDLCQENPKTLRVIGASHPSAQGVFDAWPGPYRSIYLGDEDDWEWRQRSQQERYCAGVRRVYSVYDLKKNYLIRSD